MARLQVEEIEREFGPLGVEIDDGAERVMEALLHMLPDMKPRSLFRQWAELLKRDSQAIFRGDHTFRELIQAVVRTY